MEELKKAALDTIEENKELIASVADQIWEYAELSLQEVRSAALYCKVLKEQGFAVEEGVCSISTAFVASYGSGRPSLAFWRSMMPFPGFPSWAAVSKSRN